MLEPALIPELLPHLIPEKVIDEQFASLVSRGWEALSLLPALKEVFKKPYSDVFIDELNKRESILQEGTLSSHTIENLCRIAQSLGIDDLQDRIIVHEPSFSASAKQDILPKGIVVQKTISLKIGQRYLLCTGIGNWKVNKELKSYLAHFLKLSHHSSHDFIINPVCIDPIKDLRVWPGMVSPFLQNSLSSKFEHIIVIPPCLETADKEFCISLSLFESLVFPVEHFGCILKEFVKQAQTGIEITEVERIKFHG